MRRLATHGLQDKPDGGTVHILDPRTHRRDLPSLLFLCSSRVDPESTNHLGSLGCRVFEILTVMRLPTSAFIHGASIDSGLEIALTVDYRTASTAFKDISLPEAYLGLVPGWGGIYRMPYLISC